MSKFVLLPLAAACLRAACAQPVSLPAAVVTATREPLALERVVSDLVVIDAERIRRSSADSVEDLLRREAGVQVSRNGGPGQNAAVLIRGAGANNTLVLVDGVRVGSATLGQTAFEGISLAQIERIEVLRGPGSSLYGADAVGGVVHIITRRGDGAPRLAAHAALGQLDSNQADATFSGSASGFDYLVSASHEQSDGVSAIAPGDRFGQFNPDEDGYRRRAAQLRAGYSPSAGHRVGANLIQTRLRSRFDSVEAPTFADPSPDFRNRLDTRVAALDYRGRITDGWATSLQASRHDDELASGGNTIDRFDTRRVQFGWQNALQVAADQQLVAAIERLAEEADSTPYGGVRKRHNTALVLGYAAKLGAHLLQADARHDESSIFGGVTTGKAAWGYTLQPGLVARVSAGSAFRAPSFNELFFPGFGVPTIRPERSRSVEAGLEWRDADASASITVYRNRLRNLIVVETDVALCPADPSFVFGCARNVGRARLQGASIAAAQRFGKVGARARLELLDATDAATGERLVRRAAHQASAGVDWESGAWRLDASVLAVGARPEAGQRLGAYETLDLQARYRFAPRWQVEARLLNALDRRYQPALDYQSVGRQAWIGVRYDSVGR